ncbi:MAG: hypothetical protein HY673_14515 [Chloroflexi bacterium]|nr:hypothetical protein [Chloroflexota bacterium]
MSERRVARAILPWCLVNQGKHAGRVRRFGQRPKLVDIFLVVFILKEEQEFLALPG